MPNPSPLKARQARKRKGKPGDLYATQKVLWSAIQSAETVLHAAESNSQILAACHALAQATGQYARLLEVGELEARLAALERQANGLTS